MLQEFTIPAPRPIHKIVAGHKLSLGKYRDEIAELIEVEGEEPYWSDPIWRGDPMDGERAFLVLLRAVKRGEDPQELSVRWDWDEADFVTFRW